MSCCHEPRETPGAGPVRRPEALPGAASCCHAGEPEGAGGKGREGPGRDWVSLGIALVVAGQSMMWGLALNLTPPEFGSAAYKLLHGWLLLSALLVAALLGPALLQRSWAQLRRRKLTVEALFLLTAGGALAGSVLSSLTGVGDVYYEVVAIVLVIYSIGTIWGDVSRQKVLAAVRAVREGFDRARVVTCCGREEERAVAEVVPGQMVLVRPGEALAVDGEVLEGTGYFWETAITGEPGPALKGPGDAVFAGTYAADAQFRVRVTAGGEGRVLDRILATVEAARGEPSRWQEQADRLVGVFLPVVAGVAGATLAGWWWLGSGGWTVALFNSMAVLLVACPCALGLATPIAVWSGLWSLARLGLVARSGRFLDALARTKKVLIDKTGTLSEAELRVSGLEIFPASPVGRAELLQLVEALEKTAPHPAARALARFCAEGSRESSAEVADGGGAVVRTVRLVPGQGIVGEVRLAEEARLREVRVGEWDLLPEAARAAGQSWPENSPGKKVLAVAVDGLLAGRFILRETLQVEVTRLREELGALGVGLVVLTGDRTARVLDGSGVEVATGLSPEDKVALCRAAVARGEFPLGVGDGINDAAALAVCSGSLAVQEGAGLTRAAAQAVAPGAALAALPEAVRVARRITATLRGNLVFAAGYNLIGMGLAAAGALHPVVAALLMLGSSLTVSARAAGAARLAGLAGGPAAGSPAKIGGKASNLMQPINFFVPGKAGEKRFAQPLQTH